MSLFEIKMPKLGESITEGTITSWSVKAGDLIQEDEVLFEVNTAKVSAEIPSPVAGKVIEILHKEGDTVPVGVVVAIVDLRETSETGTETKAEPENTATKSEPESSHPNVPSQETDKQEKTNPISESDSTPEKETSNTENRWYSPLVLQLAGEAHISPEELKNIKGSGYEGRVSKKDILDYIEQKKKDEATSTASTQERLPDKEKKRTTSETMSASEKVVPSSKLTPPTDLSKEDEIRDMDPIRRIIADRMVQSKKISPHVTTIVDTDVTRLVMEREHIKDSFQKREGIKLTYLPFITEAVAKALSEFPQVNASVDGYRIILHKHIHIGIAVALPDGNLIVPVIHDADKLNLNGLALQIEELTRKARNNKLLPADIEGGTFTITNFGSFKNILGTPIINQPEAAILGVGYIEKRPAVIETPEGDALAIRQKMYLSLSYDHRIVDGALGGSFLRRVADYLENPEL